MNLNDFYSCTWYEWSLWTERIVYIEMKRKQDHELLIEMFRSSLARYYNWNRGKNPSLSPEDFWTLSYDKPRSDHEPSEEEKLRVIRDLEQRVKQRKSRG